MMMQSQLEAPRHLFTVDDLYAMQETGILGEDEPVELLNGDLVVVSPQRAPHSAMLTEIRDLLAARYQGLAHVRVQCPLAAGPQSAPEPDLAVVKGAPRDYLERHPSGPDTLLVIEVALTSQTIDRAKTPIYAAAAVPVYWLVDLAARRLEAQSELDPGSGYRLSRIFNVDEMIELPATEISISVGRFFP